MSRWTGLWPHLHQWLVALLYLATFAILAAVGAVAIYATYYYFLIVRPLLGMTSNSNRIACSCVKNSIIL